MQSSRRNEHVLKGHRQQHESGTSDGKGICISGGNIMQSCLGKRQSRDEDFPQPASKRPFNHKELGARTRSTSSMQSTVSHDKGKSHLGKHRDTSPCGQNCNKKPRIHDNHKPFRSKSASDYSRIRRDSSSVHIGRSDKHSFHGRKERVGSLDKDVSWLANIQSLTERNIIALSKRDSNEIVAELHQKLKAFQVSLEGARCSILSKHGIMDALICILVKVTQTFRTDNRAIQILAEVLSERCAAFQFNLKIYVNNLLVNKNSALTVQERVQNISKLFNELLLALPDSSWSSLPIDEFQNVVEKLPKDTTITFSDESVHKVMSDILKLRDNAREQYTSQQKSNQPENDGWDNSKYRSIQILPQWNEVCSRQKPRLRKNIVSGCYSDWSHYFDVQFRLLREDFIAPLRNGICNYLNGIRGRKLKNVRVYDNVLLKDPIFSPNGVCYSLRLDFSRMRRRYNWAHSKRLLHGSLLCLSSDNFTDQVYFATVVNRDHIEMGELVVKFENDAKILSFCWKEATFVMVESCAYFEASSHILQSLQSAEISTMPFGAYLVNGDCSSVEQPQYLRGVWTPRPYNLSFILTEEEKEHLIARIQEECNDLPNHRKYKTKYEEECLLINQPADVNNWPTCEQTELDNSQLKGLQMALTQEIAVIQGPPGTGKTYIGLKIVETLLRNENLWNIDDARSPILVMCYTNHALDQFLEGIVESPIYKNTKIEDVDIIRVGGRSRSKKLTPLNLHERRRKVKLPASVRNKKSSAERNVREFADDSYLSRYYMTMKNCKHVGLQDLVKYKVIQPDHHSQMFFYVKSEQQHHLALEHWLGFCSVNHGSVSAAYARMIQQRNSAVQASKKAKKTSKMKKDISTKDRTICETEDKSDEESFTLIDVAGEALLEQSHRIIDDEHQYSSKHVEFSHDAAGNEYFSSLNAYCSLQDEPYQFDTKWVQKVLDVGFSFTPMSEEEYLQVKYTFIHHLSFENRWKLYHYWRLQYLKCLCKACEERNSTYNKLCVNQDRARKNADRFVMETASIIGMTTTGAAKYQHILHRVKPRIVIVEEAAEVLESHIVSALNAGTQHLILIGDHKQLRPKPNEHELAKKYNLDISLFERLVRNGFPHATLECQHRMRPEIAALIKPHIYATLSNHKSVEAFPDIRGVSTNLFFINHDSTEKEDENLMSHSNAHEARYLVALCRYLLQQRYDPHQITILVTYTGQLLVMRKLMPKIEFEGVRVSTVDNFQGEENDIILLSLVRSNSEGNVGFLKEENRVCVALSRARQGFYCIGNFTMLRDQVPIWDAIMSDMESMESRGKLGDGLLLHCSNHPETNFVAKTAEDFAEKSPIGGCNKNCTFRLPCGHACADKCHYTNPEHHGYTCLKPCTKKCPEGHLCRKWCYEVCRCTVEVSRTMPECGHSQIMYCYEDPWKLDCKSPCKEKCPKGHSCPLKCHEVCKPCTVAIPVNMPSCNHEQLLKCFQDPKDVNCKAKCSRKCENGHPCPKSCYEKCGDCAVPIMKVIPSCNHEISLPCHVKPEHKMCLKPCEQFLPCTHKCRLKCGEDCLSEQCMERVSVTLPECGHNSEIECYKSKNLSDNFCNNKCERNLSCGHPCDQACGDPCTTKCMFKIRKQWPCGHWLKRPCYQTADPESHPCRAKCSKKLKCGHSCVKLCSEPCTEECKENITKLYPCGHRNEVLCSSKLSDFPCKFYCSCVLACGHKCDGKCSECTVNHMHKPCDFKIDMKRYCGHDVQATCSGLSDSHDRVGKQSLSLHLICSHRISKKDCLRDVSYSCEKPCEWNCAHSKCEKLCSEVCTRPSCNERCEKKHSKCGHQCYGLCGEPCLSVCPECEPERFKEKLKCNDDFDDDFDKEELYYQLLCKHIFPVKYLDEYVARMSTSTSESDVLVRPLQCPKCSYPFSSSYRYGNHAKDLMSHVQDVNNILRSVPRSSDERPLSNKSIDDVKSSINLRARINKFTTSDSDYYIELSFRSVLMLGLEIEWQHDYEIVCEDEVIVQYQPLPEISATLYKLKTFLPQSRWEKYLVFMFTEGLSIFEHLQFPSIIFKYNVIREDIESILTNVKHFLKFTSQLIKEERFKLSYQIVIDLKCGLFQLYLNMYLLLARANTSNTGSEFTELVEAGSYLEKVSSGNSPVYKKDFQLHMDALSTAMQKEDDATFELDYREMLKSMDRFWPDVYKGQWWRCTQGHYYCSPPTLLKDIELKCPKCEGKLLLQKRWDNL